MKLSHRIRALRKQAGLTQEEFCHRAGLSLRAYSSLERGEAADPHLSTLKAIAGGLGMSVCQFLEIESGLSPASMCEDR